ncbi:calcium-binding protein [Chachezhania antarctica]|uniref:calcium-binding protein n=1 Tax=Chachezhania antarctica TaxID=2340860 RepID=UPI000EABD26E|nr:calcium-binding protein [Chachezhania antarctica]
MSDGFADGYRDAVELKVGQTYRFNMSEGDSDWFGFWAQGGGKQYTIILDSENDALSDRLRLVDADSTAFAPQGVYWPQLSTIEPAIGASPRRGAFDDHYDYYTYWDRLTLTTPSREDAFLLPGQTFKPSDYSDWFIMPAFATWDSRHGLDEDGTYSYNIAIVEGDGTDWFLDDWGHGPSTDGEIPSTGAASMAGSPQKVQGEIETQGDKDAFKVTLRSGFEYDVHVRTTMGEDTAKELKYIDVDVTLISGLNLGTGHYTPLGTDRSGGLATAGVSMDGHLGHEPGQEVEALITVSGADMPNGQQGTGGYEVWVTPADDHGGNANTPDKIGRSDRKAGRIDEAGPQSRANMFGEQDWFRIEGGLRKGWSYVVTTKTTSDTLSSVDVALHSAIGAPLVVPAKDFLVYKAFSTDAAFLSVRSTFDQTGTYEVELREYEGKVRIFDGKGGQKVFGSYKDDLLEMGRGKDTANGVRGHDQIDGGRGRDNLLGGGGNDSLLGGKGGDVLEGGRGKDVLIGGAGMDRLDGGGGNDRLSGNAGRDTLDGNAGRDTLDGGAGKDRLDGGGGRDWLSGDGGADWLLGGVGKDVLNGGSGRDWLDGDGGRDRLSGDGGADTLLGRGGNDVLKGGGGKDTARGGRGNDKLKGGGGNDVLNGGSDKDLLVGGYGDDRLLGRSGDDRLKGGGADDVLKGGSGRDRLAGGKGDDLLDGGGGRDVLNGGAGTDSLRGGKGKDLIHASLDGGVIAPGPGADRIIFDDTVEGHRVTEIKGTVGPRDTIDLSQLDIDHYRISATETPPLPGDGRTIARSDGRDLDIDMDGDGSVDRILRFDSRADLMEAGFQDIPNLYTGRTGTLNTIRNGAGERSVTGTGGEDEMLGRNGFSNNLVGLDGADILDPGTTARVSASDPDYLNNLMRAGQTLYGNGIDADGAADLFVFREGYGRKYGRGPDGEVTNAFGPPTSGTYTIRNFETDHDKVVLDRDMFGWDLPDDVLVETVFETGYNLYIPDVSGAYHHIQFGNYVDETGRLTNDDVDPTDPDFWLFV